MTTGRGPGPGLPDDPQRPARALLTEARAAIDDGRPEAALPLLEEAGRLAPEDGEIHLALGRALNNLRRLPEARQALDKATRLSPDLAVAWSSLGHVCRALGDIPAASEAFTKAVGLEPHSSRALANLASVHLARGELEAGLRKLREATAANPSDPGPRSQTGDVLQSMGRFEEAEQAYAGALEIDPGHADSLTGLGAVMHALGRYGMAEEKLSRALEIRPDDPVAVASLVHLLELQGRAGDALALLDGCRWQHAPVWASIAAARQLLGLGRREEAEARLRGLDPGTMAPRDRAAALNVRARLLEEDGDYESAFRFFRASNLAAPSGFDPDGFRASVDRLTDFFSRDRLGTLAGSGCETDRPVFIVGMPRSGTSLVEQILACHSRVHACGERTDLYRLPRRLSGGTPAERWPECLARLGPDTLAGAAREYLDQEGERSAGTWRATDKLPANFLNLGLIQLLFPIARVIYCRRDPMDAGLSCFQQDFDSPGMDFARDLAHIGLYQQGCRRLMEHWHRALDLRIHTVDYESLVAEPEREIREMIAFLGLDWEQECLHFHQSDRVARTASYDQVRQPVHDASVGRWKHYREWLGPLRDSLDAPWPDRSGSAGR